MFHIKKATSSDTALLSEIGYETFSATYDAFNTKEDMVTCLSQSFNLAKMEDEILNDKNIFLIAYQEAIPVGYALLKHNHSEALNANHPLEIARFYARTSFIGKGVGKALMLHVIDYAISVDADYLWLSVWQPNTRAINFYTKFGFSIHANTTYLLGNDLQDDWLMKKELGSK